MRSIDLESNEIGILTYKATQALDYSCGTVPESHRTFPNPSFNNLPRLGMIAILNSPDRYLMVHHDLFVKVRIGLTFTKPGFL